MAILVRHVQGDLMAKWWRFSVFWGGLVCAMNTLAAENAPDFENEIAPLLIRRCVECHRGTDPAGGLQLTSAAGLRAGGESGAVIDEQHPMDGHLMARVTDGEMPPEKQGRSQKLAEPELALMRRWIEAGAPWPDRRTLDFFERTNEDRAGRDWWSLQPVERPTVPDDTAKDPSAIIDAFIQHRLKLADMSPSPIAQPAVRIRRLYYDLIGLPPERSAVDAFVANPTDEAWADVVDRLLNSPQYGVRWARYWLDVARYADTCGYERDQEKPFAWKYRDWVVDALNADMPYNQFIVHQLAGDEMEGSTKQSTIATGFLRVGTWNDEPNDPADYVYDRLEDMVHTTSSAFLGMTVKCARCHSHKFDPIKQDDYYRMASTFWPGPISGGELGGPTSEQLGYKDVFGWTDVTPSPKPLRLLKNGEREHPLHDVVPASLSFLPNLEKEFAAASYGATTTRRRLQLAEWIADPQNPLTPRVIVNRLWQHHFGQGIVRTPNNFGFLADPPTHPKLLDWLASELIDGGWKIKRIHRMILLSKTWQQSALHPNASDFEQRDSGNRLWWRANRRRLDAEALRDSMLANSGDLDLRLGGAGFRPTISNDALEGLSRKAAAWSPSPKDEQRRRSLFMYSKRGLLPPMMTTFDMCDTTQSCAQRDSTTVPTQALSLLNNGFVHERSRAVAKRTIDQTKELDEQVATVWSTILKRSPTDEERQLGIAHIRSVLPELQDPKRAPEKSLEKPPGTDTAEPEPKPSPAELSLASLAHVLFNSNEFLYID